jgi:hypothetical protein
MFQQQIDDTAELEKKKWTWHGTHQATTKYAAPDASFFPEKAERPAHGDDSARAIRMAVAGSVPVWSGEVQEDSSINGQRRRT